MLGEFKFTARNRSQLRRTAFSSLVAMAMYMIRPFSSRTWALSAVIGWLGVVGKFYLAFTAHRSLIQHERKYLNGISDYLVFVWEESTRSRDENERVRAEEEHIDN